MAICTWKPTWPSDPRHKWLAEGADWCQRHEVTAFGVEANQFQELLADEFQSRIRTSWHAVAGGLLDSQSGQQTVAHSSPWSTTFSETPSDSCREALQRNCWSTSLGIFPLGSHDDGPDALEMAVRIANRTGLAVPLSDDGLGDRLK